MIRQINRCNINRKNLSDQLSQYHNQYDELKEKVRESEEKIAAMTVESKSIRSSSEDAEMAESKAFMERVAGLTDQYKFIIYYFILNIL